MKAITEKQVSDLRGITEHIVQASLVFRKLIGEADFLNDYEEVSDIKRRLQKLCVDFIIMRDAVLDDYPQFRD